MSKWTIGIMAVFLAAVLSVDAFAKGGGHGGGRGGGHGGGKHGFSRGHGGGKGALQVLQDTSARVAEELKAACQTGGQVLTPPARMAAAARRLDAMLQAVKQVRAALEDFYATLNDEQRAAFEAIGPARPA